MQWSHIAWCIGACSHGVCVWWCVLVCIICAFCVHDVYYGCIMCSWCVHDVCKMCAWCFHGVCKMCVWCAHGVFMVCAWCVQDVCMMCAWYVHTVQCNKPGIRKSKPKFQKCRHFDDDQKVRFISNFEYPQWRSYSLISAEKVVKYDVLENCIKPLQFGMIPNILHPCVMMYLSWSISHIWFCRWKDIKIIKCSMENKSNRQLEVIMRAMLGHAAKLRLVDLLLTWSKPREYLGYTLVTSNRTPATTLPLCATLVIGL